MSKMEIPGYNLKELINEGKTKQIWKVTSDTVLVVSKDRITAGDGAKSHQLEGKAAISTKTTSKVFEILQDAGLKTAFIKQENEIAFLAKHCEMIPIEWVTRRLATGSFLKRNVGVKEGHRFNPPLQETFFKDDENHDPQWSDEQILNAEFKIGGIKIGICEIDIIKRMGRCVFEILEKVWSTKSCVLVDMKIEFGIDAQKNILVADVIDNDSWRLWPFGDKRLMKDKQVYRNLTQVTNADLLILKDNFQWVADQIETVLSPSNSTVVILMGSPRDEEFCEKILKNCTIFGLHCEMRIGSAHKAPDAVLKIISEYEGSNKQVVFIAVAGRSNGLGPTVAGNTNFPVINCPPNTQDLSRNVWSSLDIPSGIGCSTVMYPESAALMAAHIHALHDYRIWAKLRVLQMHNYVTLKIADKTFQNTRAS